MRPPPSGTRRGDSRRAFTLAPGQAYAGAGSDMRPDELDEMKARLQRRRDELLEATHRTERDIDLLRSAEHDPELEEGSQLEQEQSRLSQLGEIELGELAQIDAALRRVELGRYGSCRDCGAGIEPKRLRALPFALDCADCAGAREDARRRGSP